MSKAEQATELCPFFLDGPVIKGFGRGSRELGIPTANLPLESAVDGLDAVDALPTGVYYGFAQVENGNVYSMVMSVGRNPFFHNKTKSIEVHILNEFEEDFYGANLKAVGLGYIRDEQNFDSLDALIKQIHRDIEISKKVLEEPSMLVFASHKHFDVV